MLPGPSRRRSDARESLGIPEGGAEFTIHKAYTEPDISGDRRRMNFTMRLQTEGRYPDAFPDGIQTMPRAPQGSNSGG